MSGDVNQRSEGKTFEQTPSQTEVRSFEGVVITYYHDTNKVLVDIGETTVVAVDITGWLSSFMGLNATLIPEAGTKCRVELDPFLNQYFITGFHSSNIPGGGGFDNQTTGVTPDRVSDFNNVPVQTGENLHNGLPKNLVQGELNLTNMYGTGLQILRFLSRLKASERALIECSVIDDFVRIVSENFQHLSSFGNFRVYNDGGRLNVRWDGTHREHEAWNLDKPLGEERGTEKGKNNIDLVGEDKFSETARDRFSMWMGHLGNFIHVFVTDPVEQIGKIAESAQNRAGRFRCHVNNDGSFLLQSAGDIVLERTVRILVPVELHTPEDPAGDQPSGIASPDTDGNPLANWVPEDEDNLWKCAYKLRDYARWFANWYSLAEFHQMSKDWKVPTESGAPEPDKDNLDEAKKQQNAPYTEEMHTKYIERYSTIRIFRDGSIMMLDAYGDSVHMGGGIVNVSAVRALNLSSAGEVNIVGRDINLSAKRSIDMTAHEGGILLRGQKWLQSLCEKGTILLDSRANKHMEEQDEGTRLLSKSGVLIRSDNADITMNTRSNLRMFMSGAGKMVVNAGSVLMELSKFLLRPTSFGGLQDPMCLIMPGISAFRGQMNTEFVRARHVTTGTKAEVPTHEGLNHVFYDEDYEEPFSDDNEWVTRAVDDANEAFSAEENPLITPDDAFSHRDSSEYDSELLYENITDQTLRLNGQEYLDLLAVEDQSLAPWDLGVRNPNPNIIGSPWPGANTSHFNYAPEQPGLHQRSSSDDYKNTGPALGTTNVTKPILEEDE